MQFSQKKFEALFLAAIAAWAALFLRISFDYAEISRLIPSIACTATLALVAVRLAQVLLGGADDKKVTVSAKAVWFALALFVGYVGGTYVVGFLAATAVFVALVMWFSGYRRPVLVLGITAGYTALMYFLFVRVFSVSLPDSLLGL